MRQSIVERSGGGKRDGGVCDNADHTHQPFAVPKAYAHSMLRNGQHAIDYIFNLNRAFHAAFSPRACKFPGARGNAIKMLSMLSN
jgi:hypothetical protein